MRHVFVLLAMGLSVAIGSSVDAERLLILDVEEVRPTKIANPFHVQIADGLPLTKASLRQTAVAGELYVTEKRAGIVADSADLLAHLAGVLERQPDWTLQIEAFTDERVTEAYGLVAGEEHSRLIEAALTRMRAKSITVTSYGQARPLCGEGSVGCWEENLRITETLQWLGLASSEPGYLLRLRFQVPNQTNREVRQVLNHAFLQRIHQAER